MFGFHRSCQRKGKWCIAVLLVVPLVIAPAVRSQNRLTESSERRPPRLDPWLTDGEQKSDSNVDRVNALAAEISDISSATEVVQASDDSTGLPQSQSVITRESAFNLLQTKPILAADRPEWVRRAVRIQGDQHFISVDSAPADSFAESLASLDESLLTEARKYVDDQILKQQGAAAKLHQLTAEWIRNHWLVNDKQYDAVLEMPNGIYHQAWVELKISEMDRKIIQNWAAESDRTKPVVQLGIKLGNILFLLGLTHLILGMVARRKPVA